MSKVWKDTDGTSVSNESHHQTVAIQRLGHGHDRQNQPSIQQGSPIHFGHHGLFHQMVEAIPMKSVTSKDVVNFIKEHVIHRFGISQTITTDGGLVFISEEFRKFAADVGIKLIRSSPYNAQANGQAEASNQSLIKLIKRKFDEHPRHWHEVLLEALWAHHSSCHGATKTSPYHLVYG
jgi:transposase InsO family protein